ncbi:MAG: sugar ABC transporter substrate-binding protein [Chloroflexota bacterium]|nr:sugar ABC transporter substrate-binding protein [Chloroflexota bacterium]
MNRRFLSLALLAVLALGLSASLVAAQDDVTLRWRTRPDNQAEIDLYTTISNTVDEGFEGVTLQYEPGGTEGAGYQATLLTELAAGTAPDVFWIPGSDIATFAEAGVILNLSEAAMGMEGFDVNVFYSQQVEQLTFNPDAMTMGADSGALWGLPRDASAMALYYNADLFEEAGIDTPDEQLAAGTWDWDAFRESSEAISALSTGDNQVYGFGMNGWWANWLLFVNSTGSRYFNADSSACGFEEPGTTDAMAYMQGLYADELAVPFGSDSEPPFVAGNVGMFLNGRWATPNAIAQIEFDWNVTEVPAAPSGERSNWLFWGAYVVNANTANPEAAFDLVTRLTSTEVQSQVTALGANIPSRNTPEAQAAFLGSLLDIKPDLNNQAFINGLSYAVAEAPLWTANFQDVDGAVGALVSDVMAGNLAPEDFSTTACETMAPLFAS